ncbi:hypothetical protein KC19_10G137800 [Ceratodon purpureus]|uniref:BRCT domain-containing protein n=1 Tax=Ceratodon purpureus TaxID=3225 RepID=A0A8T0GNX9_CERPU|nr:hypothetical protein KC19_10G137800 [Ceratodon purpureus]
MDNRPNTKFSGKRKRLQCERMSIQSRADELLRQGRVIMEELEKLEESFRQYCCSFKWLKGVTVFMARPIHSTNPDSQDIATLTLSRLQLEAKLLGAEVVEEIGYTTTHVLTYRRANQVFDTKNVLRSLGGRDVQEIITLSPFWHPSGRAVKVVYHDWLEDTLAAGKVLPVEPYLAVKYEGCGL